MIERPSRRTFLRRALAASAVTAGVPIAALAPDAEAQVAAEATGPYGPLSDPTGLGVLVPAGFLTEVIAITGQPVPGTNYVWRGDPDGAATFDDGEGGWYHVVNHESAPADGGGASCIRYDAEGRVVDAYSILTGTRRNCAGGPTPWGTWLSCEEVGDGRVWECRPDEPSEGVVRDALGVFNHEAVAVDPVREQLYLTEDRQDGLLYRFTPTSYPDLSDGLLEAAVVVDGLVDWIAVPDPAATDDDTRRQLAGTATPFAGGEGIWYHADHVFFTTKIDHGVWDLDLASRQLRRVWAGDPNDPTRDQLTGVDNLTVESGSGDLYVAEDGGNMEIVVITPNGDVAPFLRIEGQGSSELTGPVFSPDGTRLYFSSQRGTDGAGITYVVTGPFRGLPSVPANAPADQADDGASASADRADDDTGGSADRADDDSVGDDEPETEAPDASTPAPDDETEFDDDADLDGADGADEVDDAGEVNNGGETVESASGAGAVAVDPTTPNPSTTFVAATESARDRTVDLVLGGGAVAAGVAGAALIALRRRQSAQSGDVE